MHSDPDLSTPLRLWRTLAAHIEAAYALFGAPAAIAQQVWINRHQHKLCSTWIRALEEVLRRLLSRDALKLTPSPALVAETKSRAPRTMTAASGAAFDMDHPETWRARFRLIAPADRRRGSRANPNAPLVHVRASAPLALRLEAIVRAFNDREAEAQRLADLIHRRAERAAAIAELAAPAPKPRSASAYPAFNVLRDLIHEASDLLAAEILSPRAADTS